ncbi:MAG: type secretion ATPase, ClpV1 family [Deltaproteobacteria bacterium]|nr:type secretion ATPase, ClpV1 family [Deltaproteobacteria bacterium]
MRLNDYGAAAMQAAAGLCVSRTHYEITIEHLIAKLFDNPNSDWPLACARLNVDSAKVVRAIEATLEDFRTGNAAKPVFSPLLLELIQDAWLISSIDLEEKKVRSGAILLAFLSKPTFFASGRYSDLIKSISRDALAADFWTITKGSVEIDRTQVAEAQGEPAGKEGATFIDKYCTDFTDKAARGEIDPVFGRDSEIRQMIDILGRRRKNNPICVGEPGVGKTAVVEGMALRITEGDVPDMLKNVVLIGLDMGLLEAGAGVKGEFENRLKGVINDIKASEKPIILFIDEAHTLIGAGGTAGGSDAANLLKPALARGELRTIAATTWTEYKKYFEKDPALARRFQLVKLDEPAVDSTILMLRGLKASYEKAHNVVVRDDATVAAAELSDRYITGRFLPDKAIDLLDTSCSRVKINLTAKPAPLEDLERSIQACDREITALDRDKDNKVPIDEEAYKEVVAKKEGLIRQADDLREFWLKEKEAAAKVVAIREKINAAAKDNGERDELFKQLDEATSELKALQGDSPNIQIEVDPDVVAQVVSDWTGIPLGKVLKDEAKTIIELEDRLKERIKGQEFAMSTLAEAIRASKAGIKNPNQPMGVFLFVGPSGVGKTETGLVLADLLFGSDRHVVTINMSEFQESHTVSRLIGSPPGYVGYGEGGMLTEAVRQKPYCVVLLDEVEKAHTDVMNIFYQVFDKGMLTDGEGKEINFRNTIIILTSNLASDVIHEMTSAEERPGAGVLTSAIRPILSAHFKPALLARMSIVPYFDLGKDAMRMIVELKLGKVADTLMANNRMRMSYTPTVADQIAARCTEVETGARNIEYILSGNILPRLAQEILGHMSEGGMPGTVNLDVDDAGSFTFAFGQ